MTETDLSRKISQLSYETSSQRKESLNYLKDIISQHGVDEHCLTTLFGMIVDLNSPLHNNEKRFIIKTLLIPDGSYELDYKLLYRIISHIGYPQIYYHDNKKIKQKRLSLTLQNALLEWLLTFIHLFGKTIFKKLVRISTLIFNILSFEYLRDSVAKLIFLIVMNANNSMEFKGKVTNCVIKQWQIQLVVDLYLKFPLDDSLKCLLILFNDVIPNLDYRKFTPNNYYNRNGLPKISKFLKYPKSEYLKTVLSNSMNQQLLNTLLNQFNTFNRMIKKRKAVSVEEIDDIELLNFKKHTVYQVNSLELLALELKRFNHIHFAEFTNQPIIHYNNRFRVHCLILKCLQDIEDPLIIKMVSFFDNHLQNPDVKTLQSMVELGHILPDLIKSVKTTITYDKPLSDFHLKLGRIKLIRFMTLENIAEIEMAFLYDSKSSKNNEILMARYFYELSFAVKNANLMLSHDTSVALGQILRTIFNFYDDNSETFTLCIKLSFLKMLKALRFIDKAALDIIGYDLFHVPVINQLILDSNPLVVSETCGYINFLKSLEIINHKTEIKSIQNSLVVDTLNFLWRDRSFNYLGELNRGMFLHPTFIDNLPTLNTFGYSNLTQLNTVGNIFHNPTWSYLTAEAVWKLEDKVENINKRHPGPVTEDSVNEILRDVKFKWINMSYDQIKLEILKSLDKAGYVGLADLLFNSLRSLHGAR